MRYLKESFFPSRSFVDLEDLSCQTIAWYKAVDYKPHETICVVLIQQLAQETLLPLPSQEIQDHCRWATRVVTRDGLVSFDGILYSSDARQAGTPLANLFVLYLVGNGRGWLYAAEPSCGASVPPYFGSLRTRQRDSDQ